ncbi:MAG: LamG-like jellyroll fold domain-containing protein [Candidatus Micrarchaeaceae archaeon]
MALIKSKQKKGILLTLAVIVLVVLMVAEIMTYVYLNINYQTIDALGNGAAGSYRIAGTLNSSASTFLRSSLFSALGALSSYESTRNAIYINNTAYALGSLMTNGLIYGTNEITLMGGETLGNYTNSIVQQAKAQGYTLTLSNSSLQVYQTGPSSLNATYYVFAALNSSAGSFSEPIAASAGISLNGSMDLYSVENRDNNRIRFSGGYPSAVLVGNTYAIAGSTGPFQFVYGPIVYVNSFGSCAAVPSQYENANFILATPTDVAAGSCGFGGVITYTPSSTAYTVPYLVYSSSTNIMNYLYNGTSLLLNGPGLALLNLSAVQSAMHNGYYYGSTFTPAYLDWAQGSVGKRSQNGLFSFNLYNRQVAQFNGISSYVSTGTNGLPLGNSVRSVFAWIYPTSYPSVSCCDLIYSYGGAASPSYTAASFRVQNNGGIPNALVFGTGNGNSWVSALSPPLNTWSFVGYVYGAGASSAITIYLNGQSQSNVMSLGAIDTVLPPLYPAMIGASSNSLTNFFPGMISDLQVYNAVVLPQQAAQLYDEGIDGAPFGSNNLVGWWPLNSNVNDYSSMGNNGVANSVSFKLLSGYSGDPVYDGSFYSGNLTNIIEGVSGCSTINQCSNSSLQQLYLGQGSLSIAYGSSLSEAPSLGLASQISSAQFNGKNGYVTIGTSGLPTGASARSEFAWIYYTGNSKSSNYYAAFSYGQYACSSISGIGVYSGYLTFLGGCTNPQSFAVFPNTWHLVGFTYVAGSTTVTMYLDGSSQTITVNGGNPLATPAPNFAGIGGDSVSFDPFMGGIADVQLYNTALSPQQVGAMYAGGPGAPPVLPSNTLGWWPLNGNANDYSGNGRNGVAAGISFISASGGAAIPNVASFSGGYINQSVPYGWMGNGAQPFSLSIWIDPNSPSGVIVDEVGTPASYWHDSWLELVGGTLYMRMWQLSCVSLGTIPLNKWSSITMTYDGGSFYRGYVNGVLANAGAGARSGEGVGNLMYYNLGGPPDFINCGSGAAYSGSMADYQFYNTQLSAPQVSQLYQNDSVMGVNAMDRWPLSYGYNGLMNRTSDTANAPDFDLFYSKYGVPCSNANAVLGFCGVQISPP